METNSRCAKCGSPDVIANAFLQPDGHYGQVVVWTKDRRYSSLVAHVCVQCGHTELFVTNPEALQTTKKK